MATQEELNKQREDLERLIRQSEIEKLQQNLRDEEQRQIRRRTALEQKQYDDKWEGKPTGSRPEEDDND